MTRSLVTGAGTRLGRAMALYLAQRGHDVAIHFSRSGDAAAATAKDIRALGRTAITLRADLLSETECGALLTRASEGLGGAMTCLVNNASIFEYDDLMTATRDSWDRAMQSNLRAPFVLTQAMAQQGLQVETDTCNEPRATGLIVNMIDQRVRKLTPGYTSYTLAKMALWALTRSAAQELSPAIRVNAIGPGPTLQGPRQTPQDFARQRGATILGRGANPDDITAALGYFLDAPAITGQLLCVDGGQHLAWETPDAIGVE